MDEVFKALADASRRSLLDRLHTRNGQTLTALARRAVVFDNAYTTFPETIKSFVAVHGAIHPALDTPSERYEHLGLPSLGNVLSERGYRTGLFHSGRFDYRLTAGLSA